MKMRWTLLVLLVLCSAVATAELEVTDISTLSELHSGGNVYFRGQVENTGTDTVSGTLQAKWKDNGQVFHTQRRSYTIAPNDIPLIFYAWLFGISSGDHDIELEIDYNSGEDELTRRFFVTNSDIFEKVYLKELSNRDYGLYTKIDSEDAHLARFNVKVRNLKSYRVYDKGGVRHNSELLFDNIDRAFLLETIPKKDITSYSFVDLNVNIGSERDGFYSKINKLTKYKVKSECTDTDDYNVFEQGKVFGVVKGDSAIERFEDDDACEGEFVIEKYCENGRMQSGRVRCAGNCILGACTAVPYKTIENPDHLVTRVCEGCMIAPNECLLFGGRLKIGEFDYFCGEGLERQHSGDCKFHYECLSGECSEGKCVGTSFFSRFAHWFTRFIK